MKPTLLLGYDTEYYGRKAKTAQEAKQNREHCVKALKSIVQLHTKLSAPCTFFVLGKLIELEERVPRLLRGTSFDIQSHMYSHTLVKPVDYRSGNVLTLKQFALEIKKTNLIISENLGRKVTGVRMPYRYQDGLKGCKEHLKILKQAGIKFISADAPFQEQRRVDAIKANPLQPYNYENGILEIPLNGLFDTTFYNKQFEKDYTVAQMRQLYLSELNYCWNMGLVYTPAFHPWAICYLDPELTIINSLILEAKKIGMQILDYRTFAELISSNSKTYKNSTDI